MMVVLIYLLRASRAAGTATLSLFNDTVDNVLSDLEHRESTICLLCMRVKDWHIEHRNLLTKISRLMIRL